MRKPRGDSTLKTLPEPRQQEVIDHLLTHTLAETAEWLRGDGLRVSCTALSEFLSWWQLRSQFKGFEQSALTMIELLRRKRPDLSEPDLQSYANEFFQLQAIQQNDPETYLAFSTARARAQIEAKRLELESRRVALLEKKAAQADQAQTVVNASDLTPEEKFSRLKEVFAR